MGTIDYINNWERILNTCEYDSIGNDYIIFNDSSVFSILNYPYKLDMSLVIFCEKGSIEGMIDIKEFNVTAPSAVAVIEKQILSIIKFSEDFKGIFILMSPPFLENLFSNRRMSSLLYISAKQKPIILLSPEGVKSVKYFYTMIKNVVKLTDNPYRLEVVKHLILAFYHLQEYKQYEHTDNNLKSKNEILVKDFLDLVSINFKKHREMEFYANKLCLTPKYLSKLIKENSNKSGNEWINSYVILEAKALLKSTNMTIDQISNELNFADQSSFGRYFKNLVCVSPKEYRNQ
jgi:AraC-like DNA-binding protein